MKHRFVADHVGWASFIYVNFEHYKFARWASFHFGFNCSATDEIMVELHRALHACFKWCVDWAIFSEPSAEVLFETHGDQRSKPE